MHDTSLARSGLWRGVVTVILCFLFCDIDCKKNDMVIWVVLNKQKFRKNDLFAS